MIKKITAPPSTTSHHKLAVLLPSLASIEGVNLLSSLSPPDNHFHRPRADPANFSAVKVTPHAVLMVNDYETLEFIAKKMFVTKGIPWTKALQ
jgi:transcription factor 1